MVWLLEKAYMVGYFLFEAYKLSWSAFFGNSQKMVIVVLVIYIVVFFFWEKVIVTTLISYSDHEK